jgi:4-hydroxybenzoate polyprenyltransferase
MLDYLFAARPLLHLPVWSIYLVALHYHFQLSSSSFSVVNLIVMVLLSLAAAGAYFVNQVYDEYGDSVNDKVGFLRHGLVSKTGLRVGYVVCSLVALVGSALISLQLFWIMAQLVVLGYIYSAPPFRLKDRPVWGLFANAYGFGWLIVFAVLPNFGLHNLGLIGWDNPFYFMAAVGSIYMLTTVADISGDRLSGKRTIAVVWGVRPSLALALMLDIAAMYAAWHSGYSILFYLAAIAAFSVVPCILMPQKGSILLASKLPILLLTLVAGYFFPIYLLFVVALIFVTRIYYLKRFQIVYPRLA